MQHNCTICPPKKASKDNNFSVIGKTYYILQDRSVMCFRHWHQANRPKFLFKGEHSVVYTKLLEMAKLASKGEDPAKAVDTVTIEDATTFFPNYKPRKAS